MKDHDTFCDHFLKAREKGDLCQGFLCDCEIYAMVFCLGREVPGWKSQS